MLALSSTTFAGIDISFGSGIVHMIHAFASSALTATRSAHPAPITVPTITQHKAITTAYLVNVFSFNSKSEGRAGPTYCLDLGVPHAFGGTMLSSGDVKQEL
jgi:hypothetical protein